MSKVRLTIDHIVLKGFSPEEGKAVVKGLEDELSRMLADPKSRSQWGGSRRTPVLKLGAIPIEQGATGGRRFGGIVARTIGKRCKP